MSEENRWQRREPADRGPSKPSTLRFDPLMTAVGVFFAVAVPIVVVGYTRPAGANKTLIVIGIVVGIVVALLAAVWLAHRDGRVWRGPQL